MHARIFRVAILATFLAATALAKAEDDRRTSLWIDLAQGEPIDMADMLADLAGAKVVYLGERHTLQRHHQLQTQIIQGLAERGTRLVIGLEQMEPAHQDALDRFSRGQLDADQLAKATDWPRRWSNWQQYRVVLDAARRHDVPLLALNAPSAAIRKIARNGGVAGLDAETRGQLPAQMQLDDPPYARLLGLVMKVHASASPEQLQPMIEAQIARDETMAARLTAYLQSPAGKGRLAIVICGAGHASYALGMPARVERRMPGLRQRIVLFSESGDVELSPQERAMAREIHISHEDLRSLGRPIADYLHATASKP